MIIDGKSIAKNIREDLKQKVQEHGKEITLAVVLVGDEPASKVYVKNKQIACEKVGIKSKAILLDDKTTQKTLNQQIENLAKDESVHGILLQLPLPKHLNAREAISFLPANKDVDGLKTESLGGLVTGENVVVACTPKGVLALAKSVVKTLEGKNVVIVGRSVLVGKPTALLFLTENATVTICHSKTTNLKKHTKQADILVVAVGKQNLIKKNFVKKGAVVIDVGMNKDKEGKLCGDVDFAKVSKKAGYITPVPGGVGPMTIAMLLENTYLLATKK